MSCSWIKVSPSLQKGFSTINQLDDTKFEQFIRRIITRMKLQETEMFTAEERTKLERIFNVDEEHLLLAIKTVLYLFKRMLKYIFMPTDLKNDLDKIGLSNEKAEYIVKVWSTEACSTLNELGTESAIKDSETLNFSWKLNAELSSEYCKISKVPKAYICISGSTEENEIEMTHPDLYSVFLQFESIQNELDNLM